MYLRVDPMRRVKKSVTRRVTAPLIISSRLFLVLAHFTNSLRCSHSVCFVRHLTHAPVRRPTPAVDPELTSHSIDILLDELDKGRIPRPQSSLSRTSAT